MGVDGGDVDGTDVSSGRATLVLAFLTRISSADASARIVFICW
jgi:hypothetical protein